MRSGLFRTAAGVIALSLLAAPMAHAQWHGHDDHDRHEWRGHEWRGHDYRHHDDDREGGGGDALAGALIGLGLGAVLGGVIASQPQYAAPPPVVTGPPPGYYPPPGYAPAPAYGSPAPQGYYTQPYGQQ